MLFNTKVAALLMIALLAAVKPVVAQSLQEIGENDFRLTHFGADGNPDARVLSVDIAFNAAENEYLVVWYGDDAIVGKFEVFGQRIDGVSGAAIGESFRISEMGDDTDPDYDARGPAIAYNSVENEYLVVWYGDDDTGTLVDNASEIFGQRISSSGQKVGAGNVRISFMGSDDADTLFGASGPALAYNSVENEYLVVWRGDDDSIGSGDDEQEIFGQRLGGDGAALGGNFRISQMGTWDEVIAGVRLNAYLPEVAYNTSDNTYLVVWQVDSENGAPDDDFDAVIAGRIISADGSSQGENFPISHASFRDAETTFTAYTPDTAYNQDAHAYLVTWEGTDAMGLLGDAEFEIFGRHLAADGSMAEPPFRISDMGGTDGVSDFEAYGSRIAYNPVYHEYFISWTGNDDAGALVMDEYEVYGQRLALDGSEIGTDLRISDMGGDGDAGFQAWDSAVTFNPVIAEYLVAWEGVDEADPLAAAEREIYGQRIQAPVCGDASIDPIEVCDDGNLDDGDGCSHDCLSDESCGNGIVDAVAGEECDDGNEEKGDGCDAVCHVERGGGCSLLMGG